jgi:recombination protein RecA
MAKKKETKKITLDDLKKSIKKQYSSTAENGKYEVISTGSLSLDLATGIGGFPLGRIVETYGWESSGKSFIAMKTCANAVKQGYNVAYLDSEFAMDKDWAKFNGFDIESEQVVFEQPDTVEDACNIAIELAESGLIKVIVIDSLSSLTPQKELEGDVGDNTIGLKARILGQFVRKIKGILKRNNVLLITVGQLRNSIGGMTYGENATTDYGNAMKFFASMRVRYWKGIEKDNGVPIANRTTVKIEKNKCSVPFGSAKYDIVYGKGIDNDKELVILAEELGVISKSGSWYKYNDEPIGQGSNGVINSMLEEPKLKIDIITNVNKQLEINERVGRVPLPSQSAQMG